MGIGTATLTGVTLNPPGPVTVYRGSYVQFHGTAHYSDGSTEALGPIAGGAGIAYPSTCSSDDTTVAYFPNNSSLFGRLLAVANGTVTATMHMALSETDNPIAGASAEVTVVDPPSASATPARFALGFGATTLDPFPSWTAIDAHPNLVTSYTIDRGRAYELDQTQAGRATVQILDPDGILDPTNPAGPYYGQIRPMLPARLARHNPVTGAWAERYRGFVEDYSYEVDSSQRYNKLTVSLVDLFDILGGARMRPGQFGANVNGQIVYPAGQGPRARIYQILGDAGISGAQMDIFAGNVHLQKATYSAGESPLTAIQQAADGEFPGVSNVYCDRHGRLAFHGRNARFNPSIVASEQPEWGYRDWKAGDGTAVNASPSDTAQARALSFERGVSKIINSAVATEQGAPDDTSSRQVTDNGSVGTYGMRSWETSNLLTGSGDTHLSYPTSAATETKRFAQFYVANYAQPRDRISSLAFKSLDPSDPRAAANWALLSGIDIADTIEITVATPGGGGFHSEGYFVEGIHEQVNRLAPTYDEVILTLDLSPRAYYGANPWDTPLTGADTSPAPSNPTDKKTSPLRIPPYHGDSHEFGSPDPLGMHYDNVGLPIADIPVDGGGGGGGGVTPEDLADYIHWGDNPGTPSTVHDHVEITGLVTSKGGLQVYPGESTGGGPTASPTSADVLTVTPSGVTVVGGFGVTAVHYDDGAGFSADSSIGLRGDGISLVSGTTVQIAGPVRIMLDSSTISLPHIPGSLGATAYVYVDTAGYLKMAESA